MCRIDLYTKVVLTVIAAALVSICFENLVTPASARAASNEVYIAGFTFDQEVNDRDVHSVVHLGSTRNSQRGLPVITVPPRR
jgi:hypothetical protein